MDRQPLLCVKELTTKIQVKNGTVTVVDRASFDLHKGQTLAIVGESGSGKSMTALSILRILPEPPALPSEGEVLFGGRNLLDLSEKEMRTIRGDRIAMIFQDPMSALNPVYTIGDQLMEVAELHLGLYGEEAMDRVIQTLEDVRISSPLQRVEEYPHQLSGGMKQRIMIAMALMCEPDILIADEPTTALDVTIQMQVLNLMRDLQEKKGMAILLITHDMGVVAEMADEVLVMYATRIVERGGVDAIFDEMMHPYTQGLFLSRPHLDSKKGELYTIEGMVPPIANLPAGCPFHPRCPHVMEQCRAGRVPTFSPKDKRHTASCWLYEKQGDLHGC
jgi:peptide/nickel transport system ATP-binding protein